MVTKQGGKGRPKTPGSGRKKGSKNKRTLALEEAQKAHIKASAETDQEDRSKIMPTNVFEAIYRAPPIQSDDLAVLRADQELRFRAAVADAPIKHPRMAPIQPPETVNEHTSWLKRQAAGGEQ